ncbi:unnamed protein product [Enterobius vermicularis]|uniref:Uncharacterized protein n=1 Tax=Enterobius vermicularis TaxID=51028 RepID=A0A0N4VL46_ENTVE|nr:unnamed protein product [Enterobius vermicularis]
MVMVMIVGSARRSNIKRQEQHQQPKQQQQHLLGWRGR